MSAQGRSWPEWPTKEWGALAETIRHEIRSAREHCHDSSEADGRPYTWDGLVSVSASNIMARLKRDGWTPPAQEGGATGDDEQQLADDRATAEAMREPQRRAMEAQEPAASHLEGERE